MRFDIHSEEMVQALRDEINAVRSDQRRGHSLTAGSKLAQTATHHIYSFRTEEVLGAPADSRGTLRLGKGSWPVTVLGVEDFEVHLATEAALPGELREAELHVDLSFLLEALAEHLAERECWNDELLGELFSPRPQQQVRSGQEGAVEASQSQPGLFLWGPPGTGKTTTIAKIVRALALAGERVLVTAHTNVAVDAAIHKIAKALEGHELLETGKVLRVGVPATEEVRENPLVSPLKMAELAHPELALERAALEQERLEARRELKSLEREAGSKESLKAVRLRLRSIGDRLKEIVAILRAAEAELILKARVLAATLSKLAISRASFEDFDAVVVDEASMAFVPQVVYAAGLARKRVIVVGDFRQLPPICQSEGALAEQYLMKDIFDWAGVIKAVDDGTPDGRLVSLVQQYRMHPQIVHICNHIAYRGMLETPPEVASAREEAGRQLEPGAGRPVVGIDVFPLKTWALKDRKHSHFNPMSAALAVARAREAHASLQGQGKVGIIAPYAAQARLIQRLLWDAGLEDDITVATVHRFQGHERDVIVLDLVDTTPQKHPGVLLSGLFGSRAMRLLNVAVSRAKLKVIVLADRKFIRDRSSTNHVLLDLVTFLDKSFKPGFEAPSEEGFVESHAYSSDLVDRIAKAAARASKVTCYLARQDDDWVKIYEALMERPKRCEVHLKDPKHVLARLSAVGGKPRRNQQVYEDVLVLGGETWIFGRRIKGEPRKVLRVVGKRFAEGLGLLMGQGKELVPDSKPAALAEARRLPPSKTPPDSRVLSGFGPVLPGERCPTCRSGSVLCWTSEKDQLLSCCLKLRDSRKGDQGRTVSGDHPIRTPGAAALTRMLKVGGPYCPSCRGAIEASVVRMKGRPVAAFRCTRPSCRKGVTTQWLIANLPN